MKKILFLLSAAVTGASVFADDWVYDPETKYVSDGVWTFNATVNTTTLRIEINGYVDYPRELSELDFSKPVTDGDGNTYTISTLNCKFCDNFGNQDQYRASEAAPFVGKITLPGEGLVTISSWAFGFCSNMSGTIRFPNTLKTIGNNAFMNCKSVEAWENAFPDGLTTINRIAFSGSSLSGDIKLLGKVSMPDRAQFSSTRITSVAFGTNAVSLAGAWQAGPFYGCTSLTNVYFPSDGELCTMSSGGAFEGCSALEGTVDLRRFKTLGSTSTYPPFSGSHVSKLIIGTNVTSLAANFFNGMSALNEVEFLGKRPEGVATTIFGSLSGSQMIKSVVHKDVLSASETSDWQKYAEGGVIAESGTYWSQNLAGGNYLSRPLVWYKPEIIGELGDWVYDDRGDYPIVSNDVWRFKAELQGNEFVAVKEVDGWPTELSTLDFTGTVSDRIGHPCSFTSLDCGFATEFGGSPYYQPTKAHEAAQYVGELRIPATGITSIGGGSFAFCVNLTNVVNYLPDSVNTLGSGAFFKVPAQQDLKLKGLVNSTFNIFYQAGVTSVTFGPNLKSFNDAWNNAAFDACKSLTNVTFDSRCQVTSLGGSTYGAFCGCSKLGGTIDISCFKVLSMDSFFGGCPITEFIIGTNVTSVNSKFFGGGGYGSCNALTNLIFLGDAPAVLANQTEFLKYRGSNAVVRTTISRKFKASWIPFTNEGRVQHKGTHWAGAYIGGDDYVNARPISTIESDGLMMIVK